MAPLHPGRLPGVANLLGYFELSTELRLSARPNVQLQQTRQPQNQFFSCHPFHLK